MITILIIDLITLVVFVIVTIPGDASLANIPQRINDYNNLNDVLQQFQKVLNSYQLIYILSSAC